MPHGLTSMMAPVLALALWTLVVLVWLYVRRLPAMHKAGIDPAKVKGSESYASLPALDARAVWISDNYTHLHEQPTVFYALCIYSHLSGLADGFNIGLAWAYVALRIVHTFVQVTTNFVPTRFLVFITSSAVLGVMAIRNVLNIFGV